MNAPVRAIDATALTAAARKVAPLWSLEHFVAVNPFLGLTDLDFERAAATMRRVAGARTTLPRSDYARAIATGRIQDRDLEAALAEAPPCEKRPRDVASLKAAANAPDAEPVDLLPTVADLAGTATGHDWPGLVLDRFSAWAAGYFDEGQAVWASPWRQLSPLRAWHAEASLDRTAEVMGIPRFREIVKQLPSTTTGLCATASVTLGLCADDFDTYLHRLATSVSGWLGYARFRAWGSELARRDDPDLGEVLAVRLAWDLALFEAFADEGLARTWERERQAFRRPLVSSSEHEALAVDLALQTAYEKAWQRELIARLPAEGAAEPSERPRVQAVFCIDVRSEVIRRALERVEPRAETLGFAGFFGAAIEYVPIGRSRGHARCPALLEPSIVVRETLVGGDEHERAQLLTLRLLRQRAADAWRSFKVAAVSSFGFVETMGLGYAAKLVTDGIGLTRPVPLESTRGISADVRGRLAPSIEPEAVDGRPSGIAQDTRLAAAERVLRAMSLTDGFAPIVLLVGHGATTVNNPHATGLDCGACGGHPGDANARVVAAILNDPEVRLGLADRGIEIPEDTVFLGALHDTTTDEITLFDRHVVPASHVVELARVEDRLAAASRTARAERAPRLGIETSGPVDREVIARSRDWSQVRPEWGLAGCAAFIAAPRHRTAGVDLQGRCFLHSYDWKADRGFEVLELIMTAPMVVASWISLQYYGSTVDNRVLGSGNKVLHNVVGALGVLEGNGGDLRSGLPWQSVHDGEQLVHEPLRLSVMIEAPVEAMNDLIAKHETVRQLVDNGWLHLFAIDESGQVAQRYVGRRTWKPVAVDRSRLAA